MKNWAPLLMRLFSRVFQFFLPLFAIKKFGSACDGIFATDSEQVCLFHYNVIWDCFSLNENPYPNFNITTNSSFIKFLGSIFNIMQYHSRPSNYVCVRTNYVKDFNSIKSS